MYRLGLILDNHVLGGLVGMGGFIGCQALVLRATGKTPKFGCNRAVALLMAHLRRMIPTLSPIIPHTLVAISVSFCFRQSSVPWRGPLRACISFFPGKNLIFIGPPGATIRFPVGAFLGPITPKSLEIGQGP